MAGEWTADYGSKRWSVKDPGRIGQDDIPVLSVTLLPDGKSIFFKLKEVRPVMQMQISYNLATPDGDVLQGANYNTIHQPAAAYLTKGK